MTPLQIAVLAILDNPYSYKWSVQGFGMLRLYIRKIGRLHIWDSRLRYPNVSMIHNHSWDLESVVVSGRLVNTRFTSVTNFPPNTYLESGIAEYEGKRLITGYDTKDVESLGVVKLFQWTPEIYFPNSVYSQNASEIHRTDADDRNDHSDAAARRRTGTGRRLLARWNGVGYRAAA